jgi:hypothetical protein
MGGFDPMQFAGPSHFNQNASFMPQPVYSNTSMGSTLASEYRQFMSSHQQPSLAQPTVANQLNQQFEGVTNQMSQLNMSSLPQQSSLYSSYSPMTYGGSSFAPTTYGGFGGSMQYDQAPVQPMAADSAQMATNQIDDEAFERAFGEIEGATENDQDFNNAMNDWMQRHGPAAEAQAAEVNANLEQLAQEQALRDQQTNALTVESQDEAERQAEQEAIAKRREQEDLVRAASDIIDSVKDNQSEKFKKSSFIDLMRRIRAKEVVVEANALVDSESGAVIVSRPHDEMNDHEPADGSTESKSEGKKGRQHIRIISDFRLHLANEEV